MAVTSHACFLRFLAVIPHLGSKRPCGVWLCEKYFPFSHCQEVIELSSLSLSLPAILWAWSMSEARLFHSRAAVKTLVRKILLVLTNWPPRHHQPATDSALCALWESNIYMHEGLMATNLPSEACHAVFEIIMIQVSTPKILSLLKLRVPQPPKPADTGIFACIHACTSRIVVTSSVSSQSQTFVILHLTSQLNLKRAFQG